MVIVMSSPDANSNILRPSLSTRITAAPVATTYHVKQSSIANQAVL